MALLSDKDRKALTALFETELVTPVTIVYFGQEIACQYCRDTKAILDEVASVSGKVTVQAYDFVTDKETAEKYGIDKIPATVLLAGDKDYGIRFFGIPSGYEFTTLVQDIMLVSKGESGLSAETVKQLEQVDEPVHLQVFITPTCPYCPQAVHMAHAAALVNDNITADMVEAIEFPQLANKYQVQGVPRTVINEDTSLEGAAPEPLFLGKVLEGAGVWTKEQVDEMMEALQAGHTHQH